MESAGRLERGRAELTPSEFAERYADRVYRFAFMVSASEGAAEDVAQDALVTALEALPRFDPKRGTMDAWLWTIVTNRWRDRGRRLARTRALLRRLGRGESEAPSPETIALDQLTDQALIECVRRLRPSYRTVIALRYGAGLSVDETADALGVSAMAVKHRTRRALDHLREQLGDMDDGE